ncbi:MAG: hypothetical protein ACKO0Z_07975 [Betaproteobacteria bacterium]
MKPLFLAPSATSGLHWREFSQSAIMSLEATQTPQRAADKVITMAEHFPQLVRRGTTLVVSVGASATQYTAGHSHAGSLTRSGSRH